MALEDYQKNMLRDLRCSLCKWVPAVHVKSWRFAQICPSIYRYNFHAYSGGGRVIAANALITGRTEVTDSFLDIIYQCQLCGACDISCRINMPGFVEPLDIIRELRIKCVSDGNLLPQHMVIIDNLRKEDNMMMKPKAERGNWANGLDVKDLTREKADVVFHAGCRISYDPDLWPIARGAVTLLKQAGVDVGIMARDEACCGGRAYNIGYVGELTKYAENNRDAWRAAGIKKVVTACSDGFGTFRNLYPKVVKDIGIEVLHITQYLDQLIREGKLKLTKRVPIRVTYHDPCNLGRLGEAYLPWEGEEKVLPGPLVIFDPPKPGRHGLDGIYEPPRNILRSIPQMELVEMERIKEHSWCCGAGGGVIDAYPDFALFTAKERLEEAKATGAEALISACPWCERVLKDAANESDSKLKVYDVIELVQQAI